MKLQNTKHRLIIVRCGLRHRTDGTPFDVTRMVGDRESATLPSVGCFSETTLTDAGEACERPLRASIRSYASMARRVASMAFSKLECPVTRLKRSRTGVGAAVVVPTSR